MTKKFILNSCIISGSLILVSVVAVVTPIVLHQKNNKKIENQILKINPYSGIINISKADIDEITSTTNSIETRTTALSKLFEGVDKENINNLIIENNLDSTIKLKAKDGYFFNQENINSLSANYKIANIINIKPKKRIINIANEDVVFTISVQNTPKKIEILSKLFDGINDENINNFTVEKTSNEEITLIANDGFGFGSNVVSYVKANIKMISYLDIVTKTYTVNIIEQDIISMFIEENTPEKIMALSKIFDGINSININNIKVEKTSDKEITLIANDGYAFGSPTITSIKASINIVSVLNIIGRIAINIVDENDITTIFSTTSPLERKVDALSKLFNGITLENINNFKVEKTSNEEITLIANEGYVFDEFLENSIKINIPKIVKVLNINSKSAFLIFTSEEIINMISLENTWEKINALSKLFEGITKENMNNFKVEKTSTKEITLIANEGYVFGPKYLTSISSEMGKVITDEM
ncbi:MAG: hypothetical protein ACRCRP_03340 [Metamycoplasmataceae bacterium]